MRFWRSESDQQTPRTECSIGCRATGGRAGIPRCVAESRWGGKEVGRGRRVVVCRGRRGRRWRYLPGPGCRGCRRSSVVGVGRMLSMSKERGASQGEDVFLGVVCCRSLASHGANKSTMRRPGNRAHAPGPTRRNQLESFNSKLGSGPHSSSISSTRDEGILFSSSYAACQTPLLQAFSFFIFIKAE